MNSVSILTAALIAVSPLGLSVAIAQPATAQCPPGLAKKNPPCVPPGQIGKSYRIGDTYSGDGYWNGDERRRYGLPRLSPGESYYRVGDRFLRVDDDTRLVLELIEVFAATTNLRRKKADERSSRLVLRWSDHKDPTRIKGLVTGKQQSSISALGAHECVRAKLT